MIELKYKTLNNPDFGKALRKLLDSEDIKKADVLAKIARIYKGIANADQERVELHQKLVKNYGLQDPESKTQKFYIPASQQDAFDEQFKILMDTVVAIDQEPLKVSEISAVKLTAADISGLDSILHQ